MISNAQETPEAPLCVDLDGTLIASDCLSESIASMLRARPWTLPVLLCWLLRGRDHLRRQVGARVRLEPEILPYREEVLAYLREQKRHGRLLLLVGDDETCLRAVADHLGFFDGVIGRRGTVGNELRGGEIAFPEARRPVPPRQSAGRTIFVDSARRVPPLAGEPGTTAEISTARERPNFRGLIRLIRPHQWAKNVLLVLPLVTSHRIFEPALLLRVLLGFVAFSIVASAGYVFNDLFDYPMDRRHPTKRRRPIASGEVRPTTALGLLAGLLAAGGAISAFLPPAFGGLLILYLVLSTLYSLVLKKKLLVDVLCLAWLYTHRIMAGGAIASIVVSPWLMAFSMFFFLSLALAKRYAELHALSRESGRISGRGYLAGDLDLVRSMGVASGYLCVLVFCLYINGQDVLKLYRHHQTLWCACPFLIYWISRLWFLAHRGELTDDPVLFTVRDRTSYLVGAIVAIILVASI